jgi:threonine-phosphate decarboxylase
VPDIQNDRYKMNINADTDNPVPLAPVHGGDVEGVAEQYGLLSEELLDFSANINPLGPPSGVLRRLARDARDARLLMRYPEPELRELRRAISLHTDAPEEAIVIANGAASLIDAAVRAVEPKRCLLPTPSFSEYARALDAVRCQIVPLRLDAERDFRFGVEELARLMRGEQVELCIITNPHNPSGALVRRPAVERIIRSAQEAGVRVLLDEAFIDYVVEESLAPVAARFDNLVVLRSLTKFYAMPALRVGYSVASPRFAAAMRGHVPSWSVTTLAANAAAEALSDGGYASRSREVNEAERVRLGAALKSLGLRVYPSSANFLFARLPRRAPSAGALRERLIIEHRIIIRDCSSYEGLEPGRFIRVAVRDRADNIRLTEALRGALTG